MYEAIGDLEGWSDEEFANRRIERVLGVIQRHGTMERSAFFAALGIRLHEELGGLEPRRRTLADAQPTRLNRHRRSSNRR